MKDFFRRSLALLLALVMLGAPLAVGAEGLTDEATEPTVAVAEETTELSETEETELPSEETEELLPEETEEPTPEETEEPVEPDEPEEVIIEDSEGSLNGVWDKPTITFTETNLSLFVNDKISVVAEYRFTEEPKDIHWEYNASNGLRFSDESVSKPSAASSTGERSWLLSVNITGLKTGSYDVTLNVDGYVSAPIRILVLGASRYTVLVLDASGSMSGTPAAEQRTAAKKFCETLLKDGGSNYISIVKLDSSSSVGVQFTDDLNTLLNYIDRFPADSSTNTNHALEVARDLLNSLPNRTDVLKNLVICSDGLPQTGTTSSVGPYSSADSSYYYAYANACYKTAYNIKDQGYKVYSLGFFHSVSQSEIAFAKQFMADLASTNCYYDVKDASVLEFLFQNIAHEIIVDPVTVEITDISPVEEKTDQAVYSVTAKITNNSHTQKLYNLSVNMDAGNHAAITGGVQKWEFGNLDKDATKFVTWQITVDRSAYPDGGAHEFYVSAVTDQTVSSSVKGTIPIKPINGLSNELDFSTDVWNFHNFSEKCDSNGKPLEPHKIKNYDMEVFMTGYSPSDKETLREYFKKGTNGHCFGMSLTTVLSKMNIFDISAFVNVNNLRSAPLNDRIWSLLCYYQSIQILSSFSSEAQRYMAKSEEERLTELEQKVNAVKNGGSPVLLSYGDDDWGYHAVVAYATEAKPGGWTYYGTTYDHRILIYDCNAADEKDSVNPIWNEKYCLYYNQGTSEWIIPAYYDNANNEGPASKNSNAYLKRAVNDLQILNTHNYSAQNYNYTAELRCKAETNLRLASASKQYVINNGSSALITYYDDTDLETGGIGDLHVVLPDDSEEYTVSSDSGDLDFNVKYVDRYISVDAEEAVEAVFNPNGPVSLVGNDGSFQITIADDTIPANEFNTYHIKGDVSGDISVYVTDSGIKIVGDNLADVTIEAIDGDVTDTFVIPNVTNEVILERDGADLIIVSESASQPISLDQQYLAMAVGDQKALNVTVIAAENASDITWSVKKISGQGNPVSVSSKGIVTAKEPGTAEITASITIDGTTYSDRCRVDVVQKAGSQHPIADELRKVSGVTLVDTKATVELYRADSTQLRVLLSLSQNMTAYAGSSAAANTGHAIQAAQFTDASAAQYFALRVADDRTLEIIPTELAQQQAKTVKGSYTSAIRITVDGSTFTTDSLTLTVKKTLPKIKAAAVKINSYDPEPAALDFTGGTVMSVRADGAMPANFRLSGMKVVYTGSAAKASAKLKLMAAVDGWTGEFPVTVSVSVARTEPTVTLSITDAPKKAAAPASRSVAAAGTLAAGNNFGYSTLDNNFIIIPPNSPSTPGNSAPSTPAPKKVSSVTLLPNSRDTVYLKATISPVQFEDSDIQMTMTDSKGNTVGSNIIEKRFEDGIITLSATRETPYGASYKLSVNVIGSTKKATVTVKTLAAKTKPSLSVKATGAIDTAVANSPITLKPSLSNYHMGSGENFLVTVSRSKPGSSSVDVSSRFEVARDGSTLILTAKSSLEKGYTYTATVGADLTGDFVAEMEKSVKLNIKWSDPSKVKPSVVLKTSGSIDTVRPDTSVTVTPTVKNYYGFTPKASDLQFYAGKTPIQAANIFDVTVENGAYVIRNKNADSSVKYSVVFSARVGSQTVTTKSVPITVKMGTVKVAQSTKEVTLLKSDRYDSASFRLLPADNALSAIDHVEQDSTSAAQYTVVDLGNGDFAITFRDFRPASKAATVKLNVYLVGNQTSKPNASVSVKVTLK